MPQLKARPDWVDVPGVPQQEGNVDCGYYTMRYCWVIVNICAKCSVPLFEVFQSTLPYTRAELEEIREFWAGVFSMNLCVIWEVSERDDNLEYGN
ncbi:unnamed protein product [Cuscuta campestris]|uniref:Ubiquitin-like protease family profile domain-containing protein n=1 Tax=Cuscuta campestris TaxID=132261 RepID=A0A484LWP6_9ASTE|nr:unnamed protein product [Cuscuta campestris]